MWKIRSRCSLPYNGEAKALSSIGRATSRTGNIRHTAEEPKRRQRQRNCTWIYLFRSCCVSLLFCPGNRRKITSAARDEMECFKGEWEIHERHFLVYILENIRWLCKTVRNEQYIFLKCYNIQGVLIINQFWLIHNWVFHSLNFKEIVSINFCRNELSCSIIVSELLNSY
jgi:hypothetical protein